MTSPSHVGVHIPAPWVAIFGDFNHGFPAFLSKNDAPKISAQSSIPDGSEKNVAIFRKFTMYNH